MKVENVDILDDRTPKLLVQLYHYPTRTYQVIRMRSSGEPPFKLSPGVKIDESLVWGVPIYFANGEDEDDDDKLPEVFAVVFLHDEHPPAHSLKELADVEPLANVAYDDKAEHFIGEGIFISDSDEIDKVSEPTLSQAILKVLDALEISPRET